MATSNTVFRVAELDFDTIKANLREYLRSQSQFSDFDFDGAGINVLLDVLSYNTHYMAYYLNMVANEMFLDSAQLRNSVVSHAKIMNYVPTSRRAATAQVNIIVTPPGGNTTSSLLLPKFTEFQSEAIDGVNYTFVTDEGRVATKNVAAGTFTFANVILKQGESFTSTFVATPTNVLSPFLIPSSGLDTSTMLVTVQNSSLDTFSEAYTLSNDLTEVTANSKVYFLQPDVSGQYSIYFGDNTIGKGLANGNLVIVDYIVTDGDASNRANSFTNMSAIGGFSNVIVNSVSAAAGGSEAESIDDIKFRAPIAYTAQNRAVTVNDYTTLLLKDYPNIDEISVWSGADNDPIVYGKVFISLKPRGGYVITEAEKTRIKNEIIAQRSVVSITPEIVDPEFLYLLLNVKVYYDSSKTSLSPAELQTVVRNAITSYTDNELGRFDAAFMTSRLQTAIDNADQSIQNSDLSVRIQKRFTPTTNTTANYTVNFGAELRRGSLLDRLVSYPSFTINDETGISRTAFVDEVFLSSTGVDSVNVTNPGFNYTQAFVTILGDGVGATARATILNGRIESIAIVNRGSGYTRATAVVEGDGSSATAEVILSGKTGALETYYYKTTGEKIIINANAGTIDYQTGKVVLQNFSPISISSNPDYPFGTLTLNIEPEGQRIDPLRNRIVTLDDTDNQAIQITVEAV